jgi:thiamine biosynthesis lipoprotein
MGTIVTLDFFDDRGISSDELRPFLDNAVATLHHADKVFSTWKPDSPISRLRRGDITLGEAPVEVTEVLDRCKVAREMTRGWFDPWSLPGGVDPTGYVKGWAAQRAIDELAGSEVEGVMVNAAGDIASFGGPDSASPFRVGILNPASPKTLACALDLRGAIATSGTYERGEHLINPFTGELATKLASASVTGPDLGLSDALATALVVGGDEVLELIDELNDYEALAIGYDGTMKWTSEFPLSP